MSARSVFIIICLFCVLYFICILCSYCCLLCVLNLMNLMITVPRSLQSGTCVTAVCWTGLTLLNGFPFLV